MPIATGDARGAAKSGTSHPRQRIATARLDGADLAKRLKHGGMHVAAER